jgi:hypothetical protein
MHRLQQLFASADGEEAFEYELQALFEAAEFAEAEAFLAAEIETLDGDIARLCRSLPREAVVLDGWEDIVDAIAMHEGEPVTGVTLAIANELDLAFEKGGLHEPYVMLGLYTDEAFAFSTATSHQLLAECRAEEGPAWAGLDEDIELYLAVEGLAPLNTALLFHKQRHFFRDSGPLQAPLRYVDYLVGCWWRALRFQQAVAAAYARHGLPGGIPVVAGMVEMRPELVSVHRAGAPHAAVERRVEAPAVAAMSAADFIQRKPLEELEEQTGSDLRRRLIGAEAEASDIVAPKGLLGRLFGRGRTPAQAH